MSINDVETAIAELRQKASTAIEGYRARVERVNSEPGRTDQWKWEANTAHYDKAITELQTMKANEEAAIEAAIESRSSTLIGSSKTLTGPDAIAKRDADDRIEQIESNADRSKANDQALRLMQRALKSGDNTLAQTTLEWSIENGDNATVNAYIEKNPSAGDALQDLRDLNQFRGINADFHRDMLYNAISKP